MKIKRFEDQWNIYKYSNKGIVEEFSNYINLALYERNVPNSTEITSYVPNSYH